MNILLTGGTGSIGYSLVSKLLDKPTFSKICIYSRDEHKQELMKNKFKSEKLRFFIGDIRDKDRLTLACKNIQIVIHAAALKIITTAEYNPFEALKTNTLGSQNLIEACITNEHMGYPHVLALSTDKAVHPINLYGATKLCSEKLFISANNIMGPHGPKFSVVRYGNVANSNGSVIPLFMSQIAKGEQLTLTSDKMTRFWITLDEASDFILKCMNRMYGGEIFVPEMDSFNIKDLALKIMEINKYIPENQWCKIIGIRPGEKLHEEIITQEELEITDHLKDIKTFVIRPRLYEVQEETDFENEYRGKGNLSSNSELIKRLTSEELEGKLNVL